MLNAQESGEMVAIVEIMKAEIEAVSISAKRLTRLEERLRKLEARLNAVPKEEYRTTEGPFRTSP